MKSRKILKPLVILQSALLLLVGGATQFVTSCSTNDINGNLLIAHKLNTKAKEKTVMLTFDDGPLEFGTKKGPSTPGDSAWNPDYDKEWYTVDDEILDVLEKESKNGKLKNNKTVPATFFEVGSHIDKREKDPNLTKTMNRIIDSGNWIGSHSYSHDLFNPKKKDKIHNEKYFLTDIKKSYDSVDKFYKEYYESKRAEVTISSDSIAQLKITKNKKVSVVQIPLRLGYLQNIPSKWADKLEKDYGINTLTYGSWGTDWDETGPKNASKKDIAKYFKEHFKDNNYEEEAKEYREKWANKTEGIPKNMKDFAKHEDEAKRKIAHDSILKFYEDLMSKESNNGEILVCHSRTFAKFWLPELIEWLDEKEFKFLGMNPFVPDTYYKNYGELKK